MHILFSGLWSKTLSLQIGLSACNILMIDVAPSSVLHFHWHQAVYTCQKSFNFISAFACYKQKCKLVQFNFAHHV